MLKMKHAEVLRRIQNGTEKAMLILKFKNILKFM